MKAPKTTTVYAYTLEGKTKQYVTNNDELVTLTCTTAKRPVELMKVIGVDAFEAIADDVKFQTETAYNNDLARNAIKAVKDINRATIKEARTVLSLATKLNATLATKNATQWDKAIAYYNEHFGFENIGKREVKRRINELVGSLVSLEGTFDNE
jgi:hypothetical protein